MNTSLQFSTKPSATRVRPVRSALVHRRCACAASADENGQCEACENERADAPRATPEDARHTSGVPSAVQSVLRSPGRALDSDSRAFFERRFGHDFGHVRVHTDAAAAESVRAVKALAYTVGRDMVFGQGQFAPQTPVGRRLLAHELAHTVQQREAAAPSLEKLDVSSPDDRQELEAEAIADSVMSGADPATTRQAVAATAMRVARLQRVISFTSAPGPFNTNNVVANEDAGGFTLASAEPTFEWTPDVTVHGVAADPFTEWETSHHQVAKGYWLNIWWGTGADRTHRLGWLEGGVPMRDVAQTAANTWYSDWRAQGFTADGDVRSPVMRDTPNSGTIPWANPIAGRGGARGWFNYGFGFVSTLSARHIPAGTGAAAFRHLDHVHWNFMVDGTFDTTQPVGARVSVTGGGVNRSGVIPGFDVENRPMHGTPVVNDRFRHRDT